MFVPMTVLFEVLHTLRRKSKMEKGREYAILKYFLSRLKAEYININFNFLDFFCDLKFLNQLKTADAIVASSSVTTNSILVTWDKKLLELSFAFKPSAFLD